MGNNGVERCAIVSLLPTGAASGSQNKHAHEAILSTV
jgi:hypothetical protein